MSSGVKARQLVKHAHGLIPFKRAKHGKRIKDERLNFAKQKWHAETQRRRENEETKHQQLECASVFCFFVLSAPLRLCVPFKRSD